MHPGLQGRSIHREDGTLKEGGLIMRLKLLLLATMTLVVVASGSLALAASSLVNGNFETGDLSGWTVDTSASGGTASAVASYDYCSAEGSLEGDGCGVIATMNPKEGSYFALLTPGTVSEDTMISQPFDASNGDKVSGWAFFRTGDYLPYDDKAQVVIKSDSGNTVATPFEESVSSVGQNGNSGWKYWEYTFSGLTGTGQFHIEARIHNTGDSSASPTSAIGLDDVKTSTGVPDTTAPDTSITSGPNGPTNNTAPTFTFSGSDNVTTTANLKFQYRLDSGGWSTTSPSTTATPTGLSEGAHLFEVRAVDEAGNVDASPAQRSFTVDTTAPKVDRVSPLDSTKGVARGTNVTATFSERMDPFSITTSTFKLFKCSSTTSTNCATQVTNAPVSLTDGLTATLNPYGTSSTLLASRTKYKAVVTTGVRDEAGNALNQQNVWYFTTGRT
jgi:hypothetical protein